MRSQYVDGAYNVCDGGDYTLRLTKSVATLTRTSQPRGPFLPAAIENAHRVRMSRENWDAGLRTVYPFSAGVPLAFLEEEP